MLTRQRILIVEDERIARKALTELLEDKYDVFLAKNGKQALERVNSSSSIDLILLDIMMPELNGYETCTVLKNTPSTAAIPVIFLSAKTDKLDIVKAFAAGGVDYITKPFHKEEVLARIETHLGLLTAQRKLKEHAVALAHEVEQRKKAEEEQKRLIEELQNALAEIKQLSGLLPICSYCKKIRDDNDYWCRVDKYIEVHSEVRFSHSICPECAKEHYSDIYNPDIHDK